MQDTFNILTFSEGNPGCMQFVMCLLKSDRSVEVTGVIMLLASCNITGSKAYMFWNDCCDRDINECWRVLDLLRNNSISKESFIEHINTACGRGVPFS